MSDLLTNIGNFIGSPAGKGALATAGLGSNIFGAVKDSQAQSQYNSAQSYLNNLIQNPTAFSKAAAAYTQPLNQGLITNITNSTNAQLAERGLGGSSAITQQTLAQALAPYLQQNQQQGQQALLNSLGLIGGLKPTGGGAATDITKLLAQLRGGATPSTGSSPAGLAIAPAPGGTPDPSFQQMSNDDIGPGIFAAAA